MRSIKDRVNKIFKRLKSKSGETIGEVLVALLISSLALLMLAGAITSSTNLVEKSRKNQEKYYAANDYLNGDSDSTPEEGTIVQGSGTVTIGNDINQESVSVNLYVNTAFGRTPVAIYEKSE